MTNLYIPDLASLKNIEEMIEDSQTYIEKSLASNTRRAYRADWKHFTQWCDLYQLTYLPATPETVVLYLAQLAKTHTVSTIGRRLASIHLAHKTAGHLSPTKHRAVEQVIEGIRRSKGTTPTRKQPAVTAIIGQMVNHLPDSIRGSRDRALLLVGFSGAFRRSELVSLNVADIQFVDEGLIIHLGRSKTDQHGKGRKIGLSVGSNAETCPVRTLRTWFKAAELTKGPIFRPIDRHGNIKGTRLTAHSVALIVKDAAKAAGLDPQKFSGHSLRAGFATAAAQAGVEERVIAEQTGHKSLEVLRHYIRDGDMFRDNPSGHLGL